MSKNSKAYKEAAEKIDRDKLYTPLQAAKLAKETSSKKQDATVEVAIRLGVDPRKADQRYGRAIVWPLLRYGNHPVFIARRNGRFIDPEGADQWHYVAMVRYRSKRDFLRFALKIERADIAVHKWAAIEKTHVFPVQALVSLVFVRATVASALVVLGIGLWALVG